MFLVFIVLESYVWFGCFLVLEFLIMIVLEMGRRCDLVIEDVIWSDNGKIEEWDFFV